MCKAIIIRCGKKCSYAKTVGQVNHIGFYAVMLGKSDIIDSQTALNLILYFRIVIKDSLEIFYLYKPFQLLRFATFPAIKRWQTTLIIRALPSI